MPDVCDKVLISSELERIFQKHYERIYMLTWFIGIIRKYRGKFSITKMIRERYLEPSGPNMQNKAMFTRSGNENGLKAVGKFTKGTTEFLEDFNNLSHTDIDLIIALNDIEARGVGTARKSQIKTIGGKPIKLEV